MSCGKNGSQFSYYAFVYKEVKEKKRKRLPLKLREDV